jgi:hypothetical protein
MNTPRYQQLPGRGATWSGPSRLWQGEDHILLVLTRGYTEAYRRFFFNDIQAVIVRRTHTGKIWNAVWALMAAFFAFIALQLDGGAALTLWCLSAPFAIALLINLVLGPTCACHLRTAVQTERLPALSRVRAARQFLTRIEPLIQAAQGELSRDLIAAELGGASSGASSAVFDTPPVIAS